MSSNTHKNQFQSLSSLSFDQNFKDFRESQHFAPAQSNRKSSFQLVNMADSNHFNRNKVQKSLDLLNSSIAFAKQNYLINLNMFALNDEEKTKIENAGREPLQIGQIESQSENYDQESENAEAKLQPILNEESQNYKLNQYLPVDLAKLLIQKEIPLQYVRGLLMMRDHREIKTLRRLKVQRYLQKRRNKTWNKKICYNCRQKVAEERLRIKGKFIKKRRAMQILGITTPISTNQVKRLLENLLQNKNFEEIEEIIKKEELED